MSSAGRVAAAGRSLRWLAGGGQIRREDLIERRVVLGTQIHLVGPAVERTGGSPSLRPTPRSGRADRRPGPAPRVILYRLLLRLLVHRARRGPNIGGRPNAGTRQKMSASAEGRVVAYRRAALTSVRRWPGSTSARREPADSWGWSPVGARVDAAGAEVGFPRRECRGIRLWAWPARPAPPGACGSSSRRRPEAARGAGRVLTTCWGGGGN